MTRWLDLLSGLVKLVNRLLDSKAQRKLDDDREGIRSDPIAAFDDQFGGVHNPDRAEDLHGEQADAQSKASP